MGGFGSASQWGSRDLFDGLEVARKEKRQSKMAVPFIENGGVGFRRKPRQGWYHPEFCLGPSTLKKGAFFWPSLTYRTAFAQRGCIFPLCTKTQALADTTLNLLLIPSP